MSKRSDIVLWFKDVDKDDVSLVGGKGANLGEMTQAGFPVPNGFIVTSHSYYHFIRENRLTTKINHLVQTANFDRPESLLQVSQLIKKEIMAAEMSEELQQQIFSYYRTLSSSFKDALVAVRSSATAEDLPTASFAGQQETYLNVKGEAALLHKIKEAWASLFEARAMFYRHEQHFDHFRIGIAIVVQKMVESEKSGVMFTIDPITNDKNKIIIEAIYGLGEYIVQGTVTPDHYEVDKKRIAIEKKEVKLQDKKFEKQGVTNKEIHLPRLIGSRQKIADRQILALAEIGKNLEKHYFFPQDIEWAIEKNKLYIVQTRATTTIEDTQKKQREVHKSLNQSLPVILTGASASPGIASGPVKILTSIRDLKKIMPGDVLVAPQTNHDYLPAMKKASAILTEQGDRTSHAAIVSRELGIPAVVGTETATSTLAREMLVTVNGSTGEVYRGGTSTSSVSTPKPIHADHIRTATKVYVNLAQPEFADRVAHRHVDGVGLLQAESILTSLGVHPKKMIRDGRKKEFISRLADQLEMFCKAFDQRPVVYRATDFKTNEYRGLVGGKDFEPIEPNPMLGYRGAFRYIHDPEVFELELEAIKIVRNKRGYGNLWMMVPFVRNVRELQQVKRIMAAAGLERSPTFKIWMMVEIPANVILLDKFIEVGIDGVSIGSNDLTMLMLGTDRDNSEVAREYDEQNDAMLWAFEHVIKLCNAHKITVSMCGQAPSLYPALLEKLVKFGITSVSVAPDVIETVRRHIAEVEKKI